MNQARFRVATYNVHKCRGIDRRTSPARVADVIRELDADVVAVQEILNVEGGRPEFAQVESLLAELTGYQHCFGETRKLFGGEYGNLTLSRFPIQLCRNYDLTWSAHEPRGCLRTDIRLRDGVMHLFNLHLGTGFVERRHQARELLSSEVLNRSELSGPRIIAGDFNEWTRGLASRLMCGQFERVPPRRPLRYARSYPGLLPLLHLDHIYFEEKVCLTGFHLHRSRKALMASDHLPLVADFEFHDKGSAQTTLATRGSAAL